MAYTDINGEDRMVQATFADHLENELGWESVYAWNHETFGPDGTLGRKDTETWCWCATCARHSSG